MRLTVAVLVVLSLFLLPVWARNEPFTGAKVTTADSSIKVNPEDVRALKERVKEYWDWRIKNKYIKAFDYEDPLTKEKYNIDLEEYLSSKAKVKYHSIRIDEIKFIRPDYAKVKFYVKYTFDWLEKITDEKDVVDKWVKRKDGKWYRIFTTNLNQTPLEK